MSVEVQVHSVTNVYNGKLFNVVLEKVTLPNGVVKDREIVRHPGAAAMVPILDDGSVVLVKQYRHAVGKFVWEIPAGTLEPGEGSLECAQRELLEETGYRAATFHRLTAIWPAPGYTDEEIHIFLATGLTMAEQRLQDDEVLKAQPVPFNEAIEMIAGGAIQDGKTIVGLLLTSLRHETLRGYS